MNNWKRDDIRKEFSQGINKRKRKRVIQKII